MRVYFVGPLFCALAAISIAQPGSVNGGLVQTIAGSSLRGYAGDGGDALASSLALSNIANDCDPARYEQPSHIASDQDGNLYIADSRNQRIRKITADSGLIATIAGSGEAPTANTRCEPSSSIADGPALAARLFHPAAVLPVTTANGVAVIIADQWNNRIRQVSADGARISTIAGNGQHNIYAPGIPATASPMDWPSALAADSKGLIYFAELHGNRIGRIEADGRITTVAGTGFPGATGDNGPATRASLNKPTGLAFDAAGNLYIADSANHKIRKVAVATGIITTIAGNGRAGFCGDGGPAKDSCLNTPMDVKASRSGDVYIADTLNHRVRRIDDSGAITTVAGTGEAGKGDELISPLESALDSPSSLALVEPSGVLLVLDWQNFRIRRVDRNGALPLITAASNAEGAITPGSIVTITGANFSSALGDTAVTLDGVALRIVAVAADRIDAALPDDAAPGSGLALVVKAGPYFCAPFPVDVITPIPATPVDR